MPANKTVCLLFFARVGSRTGTAGGRRGYASVHGDGAAQCGFQILGKYASIRAGMQLPYFVKMYIYTPNSKKRPSIRVFWNVSRMFHADFGCMRKM